MKDLRDAIYSNEPNTIRGSYKKDEGKARRYTEAVKKLDTLMQETGLFAYKADDVTRPQYIHSIEIRWFRSSTEIDAEKIGSILTLLDSLTFSRRDIIDDTWIVSSEIYDEA